MLLYLKLFKYKNNKNINNYCYINFINNNYNLTNLIIKIKFL